MSFIQFKDRIGLELAKLIELENLQKPPEERISCDICVLLVSKVPSRDGLPNEIYSYPEGFYDEFDKRGIRYAYLFEFEVYKDLNKNQIGYLKNMMPSADNKNIIAPARTDKPHLDLYELLDLYDRRFIF